MNNDTAKATQQLLRVWSLLLVSGRASSNKSANTIKKTDPEKRIHRITGPPVVFDRVFCGAQIELQKSLSILMPEHVELINVEPDLNGYHWKISDYIELYFDHYELIVAKLKETFCAVERL